MPIESLEVAPPKVSFTKLTTGETLEVQYNPTELTESVSANWARLAVLGLSHQPMQFAYTENLKYELQLPFSAQPSGTSDPIHYARRFLMSCVYPRSDSGDVRSGGAPRVLFIWPGMVAITAAVTKVEFKHTRFNKESMSVAFTASVSLEEIRHELLTSEDVQTYGAERAEGDPRAPRTDEKG